MRTSCCGSATSDIVACNQTQAMKRKASGRHAKQKMEAIEAQSDQIAMMLGNFRLLIEMVAIKTRSAYKYV